MKQSTLSPHIVSIYREEMERALDEFAPRMSSIFICGLENAEHPICCNYCNVEEIEPRTKPCKYLLVDAENLLVIPQKILESYKVQSALTLSDSVSSAKRSMKATNLRYKELEKIFSSALYTMFVKKSFLESLVVSPEATKTYCNIAKRLSRRVRKGRNLRTLDQKNQLFSETILAFARKFDLTNSPMLGFLQELEEASGKDAVESMNKFRQSHIGYWHNFLKDLEDLCEAERPRLKKIKRMAEKIIPYMKDPELEEEHKSVKVLTRKRGKIEEEVRRFSFYISEVQKREETRTKKRKKHPERERVEEYIKKLEEELERKKALLAHASAGFSLDAFSAHPNPIQTYRSLQGRIRDLNRRKKELELKKSTVLKRISNLDECVNLPTGSPVDSIENIGPYCYREVKKIGIEIIRKVQERKRIVEETEKQVWGAFSDKQIRLMNWVKRVKIKNLANDISKFWKISNRLGKVETNMSGGKIVKKDGTVKRIRGVEKEQKELEDYVPKLFYTPIEEEEPPKLRLSVVERGLLDSYIEGTHPIIPPLIEARQIVTPLTAKNG